MPTDTRTPIDPELIRKAQRRVSLRMGFFSHALVYVVVNAGLVVLNVFKGGPLWSFLPMAGWGIGLAAHGLSTWVSLNGDSLRDRMLKQEIDRLNGGR
jgi:2TM domain